MGVHDSSLTRVAPVFAELMSRDPTGRTWLDGLLQLPTCGHPLAAVMPVESDLTGYGWGSNERRLAPPLSLLSWLIRNLPLTGVQRPSGDDDTGRRRQRLFDQDPATISEALGLLTGSPQERKWYILEGMSQPDAYLETQDAIIIVEGKRTEAAPTIGTTWMPGRHQILRHLDAAWEIRGHRRVYGMLIVEGEGGADAVGVPSQWAHAGLNTISTAAIEGSLPHRGPAEQLEIARCFVGVTTWQAVCKTFGIDWSGLPDSVQ